jgi:hypothetical protein
MLRSNAHRRRNHDFECLGQNDQPHGLVVVQPQRFGRLELPFVHALKTAANHLRDVGGCEENNGHLGPQNAC